MTWKQLDHYFEYLLQKQMIKKTETTKGGKLLKVFSYQITNRGKELLVAIEQIKKYLN